ncbi:hypothetical protein AAFF_G00275510 [Aldrovandia affinis]|uniref:Uncharacterized protein n=1 Tax=Aldrovandia affinis TaxID=143900 RepID=A0AAD7SRX1_9TELE|nr:hypothetical protein AAFF_G00275510 [Aldrovandia affinis]
MLLAPPRPEDLGDQLIIPVIKEMRWVPVCGVYSPETASNCPFFTLDISSGSWNASWAKHDSERPGKMCSSEQLDTFFKTFTILETPMKQLGVNTTKHGDYMVTTEVLHLLKHYCHYCANWVITFIPEEWRPSPHVLFWFAAIAFFIRIGLDFLVYLATTWTMILSVRQMLCAITSIFYWAQGAVIAHFWWVRGKAGQNRERLEAEHIQIQELEEKNRILEREKVCLELGKESLERKLEAQLTLQQTLESMSKAKDMVRSQRPKIQELEQELKKNESTVKTEMICHRQQMEETLMHASITEQNLEIERKESAFLRQKLTEVSTQLEETKRLVFVTPVKEGNVKAPLERQRVQKRGRNSWEVGSKSALERLQDMRALCQRKDQALQQKTAQVESERWNQELKMKALLRAHKREVQEITERHLRAELCHKAEIESLKKKLQENLAKAYTS